MRNRALIPGLFLLLAIVAGPALANEIIYFTNGTTLAIRTHTVEDGMVHVDLGSDALMAFPAEQVEKIVAAGEEVYVEPSFGRANTGAGRADGQVKVDPAANPTYGMRVAPPTRRKISRGGTIVGPDNQESRDTAWQAGGSRVVNEAGLVQEYPLANGPNAASRKLGVVGRKGLTYVQPGDNGAVSIGSKQGLIVNSRAHTPRASRPDVARFRPIGGAPPAPDPSNAPPPSSGNAGSGSSAGNGSAGAESSGGSD